MSLPLTDIGAMKAGKVDPPETMGQAGLWDQAHAWYLAAGLCGRCASQMAWGHQIGWRRAHAPCASCRPIIRTFPLEQVNGWCSVPEKSRRGRKGWSSQAA